MGEVEWENWKRMRSGWSVNRRRGYSILELMIAISLFAFITIVSFLALRQSSQVFTSTSSRDQAVQQLVKARQWLQSDLELVRLNPTTFGRQLVPPSIGGGADSDAVWFLSAIDPTTRQFQLKPDGSPYWTRNILYYGIVPQNYAAGLGYTYVGGDDGGYESSCPTKQLVRVVLDQNSGNDPINSATEDILLPSIGADLTRPATYFQSTDRKTIATNLLTFRCQQVGSQLLVDLRAVAIKDAGAQKGFGPSISYANGKFTIQHRFLIQPKN